MGQAAAACTNPSEISDVKEKPANTTKIARDLPIGNVTTDENRFTNRITLRPDDVVEGLVNPSFWETENQQAEPG